MLDRNYAAGRGGVFWQDLRATFQGHRDDLLIQGYLTGLCGGRPRLRQRHRRCPRHERREHGESGQVICWAGDGGTYDIGIATLSAAAERNEDLIYICYDNEIYGNTGGQRSSATPSGARTTTTPAGR